MDDQRTPDAPHGLINAQPPAEPATTTQHGLINSADVIPLRRNHTAAAAVGLINEEWTPPTAA